MNDFYDGLFVIRKENWNTNSGAVEVNNGNPYSMIDFVSFLSPISLDLCEPPHGTIVGTSNLITSDLPLGYNVSDIMWFSENINNILRTIKSNN